MLKIVQLPLSKTIQKEYREILDVSQAPMFIDTDQNPIPVVLVNPPDAGANANIIERGSPSIQSSNLPTGTGSKSVNLVVPAGKRWLLKHINLTIPGTVTITSYEFDIYMPDGLTYIALTQKSSGIVSQENQYLTTPFQLEAGWYITITAQVSVYSSGNAVGKVFVQESDA